MEEKTTNSVKSLKQLSSSEIETAIANALFEVTGAKYNVTISRLAFDSSIGGRTEKVEMKIQATKNPEPRIRETK